MRNKKIIAIGGIPGSGKTYLVQKFIEMSGPWEGRNFEPLIVSMYSNSIDCYILGKYEEGEIFAGTDRLSMAVQPQVEKWIKGCNSDILFEGDRLFNQSFLEFLLKLPETQLFIIYLLADAKNVKRRYEKRGSNQSKQFIAGRETKYSNLLFHNMKLRQYSFEFQHNEEQDTKQIIQAIGAFLSTGKYPEKEKKEKSGIMKFIKG